MFGSAGGEMSDMYQRGDQTHLVFKIPSRGTMGLRTRLLNVTRGEATMFHHFSEYGPYRGEMNGRKNGSMISMSTEKSVAYALDALQERGRLFVGPGQECYEGMIVGESSKEGDMVVNIAKSKQLGNQRSSGADKAISLTPPITFTLEEALEYIEDDELVEVHRSQEGCQEIIYHYVRMRPDQGAFLQEGNKASARANRRVYP